MKHLPGNPHANDLLIRQSAGNNHSPTVQANLALAFEQRTANLIAYQALWNQIEDSQPLEEVDNEMAERLGLRKQS